MGIVIGQIAVMALFFVGALMSTLTPVLITRRQKLNAVSHTRCMNVINVCNSIGGGVLLATCFIALVPLVEHSYAKALSKVTMPQPDGPYAEITILSGFFLVIFIEQLITIVQRKNNKNGAGHHQSDSPEEQALFSDEEENVNSCDNTAAGHSHNHIVEAKSLLRSVILVITLGIHTLFEGMAIGLIHDVDMLVTLVIAVMLHELCCAIALGVNLAQQKITKKAAVIVCIVFSLMMPSGIGLGLALGQVNGFGGLLLTAILQGIATGTFIYVLFIEIIPGVISTANAIVQMVLMFTGCVFMTLLIVFTHSHSDHVAVTNYHNATTQAR